MDLITHLLCTDAGARYSAAEALQHPWVKACETHIDAHLASHREVVASMRAFSDFSAMRKLMLQVVAFTLTAQQIADVRLAFEALDTDKSGTLDIAEVRAALLQFEGVDNEEAKHIFAGVTVHAGHTINYNEFIAASMWRRIELDEERIHVVFDKVRGRGRGEGRRRKVRRGACAWAPSLPSPPLAAVLRWPLVPRPCRPRACVDLAVFCSSTWSTTDSSLGSRCSRQLARTLAPTTWRRWWLSATRMGTGG